MLGEITLGFSLAGWDEQNYVVQYRSPQLAAYRVLVLPADPPLLSGPTPPQETLTESEQRRAGKFPGREITSVIDKRCIFDGFAESLRALAFARDSIE